MPLVLDAVFVRIIMVQPCIKIVLEAVLKAKIKKNYLDIDKNKFT